MLRIRELFRKSRFLKARERRYIRRYMRGFQVLKKNGQLEIISVIKEELSRTSFKPNIPNNAKFVFSPGIENSELVLRQFLIAKLLTVEFNKSLLLATLRENKEIRYPLPREWRKLLENNGFIACTWVNSIKWVLFILTYYFSGVASIVLYTWKSFGTVFKNKPYNQPFAYFNTLAGNNFPVNHGDGSQSHDIVSWYRQWNGKSENVKKIAHSVLNIPSDRITDDLIFMQFPFPFLHSFSQIFEYSSWGAIATIVSFFNLFLGKYWYALLLREASKANIVRFLDSNTLAKDYLFHNSNHIFRPLWSYAAEEKGSRILFYFYSTNCETFKTSTGYPLQEHTWHVMNWTNYLVWDQYQADFINRCVGKSEHRIHVVGPIWFSTSTKNIPSINTNKAVAVFDVQPMRDSYYCILGQSNGYNTPHIVNQLLSDVSETLLQYGFTILFKRKRNIGNLVHKKYFRLTEELKRENSFITVDPELDAFRLIERSAAVISMPFTSTAILGKELGKPSIYYDPYGQIQKDDRAAHGIRVIVGRTELKQWLDEIFKYKKTITGSIEQ